MPSGVATSSSDLETPIINKSANVINKTGGHHQTLKPGTKIFYRRDAIPEETGHLPFLENYKNPCWREIDDENRVRVRCLPYFYMAAFPKCGTTDFYTRVKEHPQLSSRVPKGPHWITRFRFMDPKLHYLSSYLKFFDTAAEEDISKLTYNNTYHPMVIGNCTPTLLWYNFRLLRKYEHSNLTIPPLTNADVVHGLTPNAKIIVFIWNSVTSLDACQNPVLDKIERSKYIWERPNENDGGQSAEAGSRPSESQVHPVPVPVSHSQSVEAGSGPTESHVHSVQDCHGQSAEAGCHLVPDDKPQPSTSADDNMSASSRNFNESKQPQKPFTDIECISILKTLFDADGLIDRVHNKYLCAQKICYDVPLMEKRRLLPKKFNHGKLADYWWLAFVEGQGMYCLVCKKHKMVHSLNKKDVFVNTPSTRFIEDALKCHAASNVHKSAIETEYVHRLSTFHSQVCEKKNVETSLYENVFSTVYFLMKNFVSNMKLIPLLDMIETVYGYDNLKYFDHKSAGSQRDFFITMGETVKDVVVEKVSKASAFGLLTDEVSDISVTEHLITFVQYFDDESGKVQTSYLSCQNILEHFPSANAQAISNLILDTVASSGLQIEKLTGFSSDGASVMVGKRGGVAALLRLKCPTLINIHCICHKLALSCTDSNEGIKYIKDIELILRQLWSFFENSPKRMAAYLKIQMKLKDLNLSKGASKTVATRLKKACRTRWLSFDASVTAVHNDYEAVLQTLTEFEHGDAIACGLLKKIRNIKFLGVIYILKHVLPVLSNLSRIFQSDSFCFSSVTPEVNAAKDKLSQILEEETPLVSLQSDIDSIVNISAELKLSPKSMDEIQSIFKKYIHALKENIDRRFSETSEVVASFCIFDPLLVPDNSVEFKEYGNKEIKVLGQHFYNNEQEKLQKLTTEWNSMKYHLRDVIKPKIPQGTKLNSTEWCLIHLLSIPVYKQFFPQLCFIAEVAVSLPVTNAWPERGASALKNIKTRHRNRLQNEMLEALLQVTINGPKCEDSGDMVKKAVKKWLNKKSRKKLYQKRTDSQTVQNSESARVSVAIQTEDVIMVGPNEIREEVNAALKRLCLEGIQDDSEESEKSENEI